MRNRFDYLSPAITLCVDGLDVALAKYEKFPHRKYRHTFKYVDSSELRGRLALLVHDYEEMEAIDIVDAYYSETLDVKAISHIAVGDWMLVGPRGIVWSSP